MQTEGNQQKRGGMMCVLACGNNSAGQLGVADCITVQVCVCEHPEDTHRARTLPGEAARNWVFTGVFPAIDGECLLNATGLQIPRSVCSLPVATVRSIVCGNAHLAVVTTSHELLTMGDNQHGQLGLGDACTHTPSPHRVASQVLQAAAGHSHTVFVTLNGSLFGFGCNRFGQLGQPRRRNTVLEPALVQSLSGATCVVACGDHHTLVVTDGKTRPVLAFGHNEFGQLGLGFVGYSLPIAHDAQDTGSAPSAHANSASDVGVFVPTCVDLAAGGAPWRPVAVACGRYHSLLLRGGVEGGVYACGRNVCGQVGLIASATAVTSPVRVTAVDSLLEQGEVVRAVACGGMHSAALTSLGRVVSWGSNAFGQCGVGIIPAARSQGRPGPGGGVSWMSPSVVSADCFRQPMQDVVQVACGAEHMVLMSGDGRVYACGCNAAGQLGLSYDGAGQLGGEASAGEQCVCLPTPVSSRASKVVFAGGDATVCVPIATASAADLREAAAQRRCQRLEAQLQLLRAAVDVTTTGMAHAQNQRNSALRRLREADVRAALLHKAPDALEAAPAVVKVGMKNATPHALDAAPEALAACSERHIGVGSAGQGEADDKDERHEGVLSMRPDQQPQLAGVCVCVCVCVFVCVCVCVSVSWCSKHAALEPCPPLVADPDDPTAPADEGDTVSRDVVVVVAAATAAAGSASGEESRGAEGSEAAAQLVKPAFDATADLEAAVDQTEARAPPPAAPAAPASPAGAVVATEDTAEGGAAAEAAPGRGGSQSVELGALLATGAEASCPQTNKQTEAAHAHVSPDPVAGESVTAVSTTAPMTDAAQGLSQAAATADPVGARVVAQSDDEAVTLTPATAVDATLSAQTAPEVLTPAPTVAADPTPAVDAAVTPATAILDVAAEAGGVQDGGVRAVGRKGPAAAAHVEEEEVGRSPRVHGFHVSVVCLCPCLCVRARASACVYSSVLACVYSFPHTCMHACTYAGGGGGSRGCDG